MEYFCAGHIGPIRPVKTFSAASIQDAFRYMQQGKHIGKIVVSMRASTGTSLIGTNIAKIQRPMEFDSSAYYLFAGGLGGIGRAISSWMVERGARHLIYLSRSAVPAGEHSEFIRELESMGCDVQLVKGSVANAGDVKRAVQRAQGHLKGVLQMSMILSDQAFDRMTIDQWNIATAPKVQGTWNLHNETLSAGASLDFFVLFSSMSGTIGNPGQANYAAANTFLDSFVQYRTSLGLAASAIDIGAVEDVGYISHDEILLKKMRGLNTYGIREPELLEALGAAMTTLSTNVGKHTLKYVIQSHFVLGLSSTTPLSSSDNRAVWKTDSRMAVYHNTIGGGTGSAEPSTDILKTLLSRAKTDTTFLKDPKTSNLLAEEIGKKLCGFLLKPSDNLQISTSVSELGMDSLVAIEMRRWWRQVFGFDISVLEMLGIGTLEALGQHAAQGLLKL